MFFELIDLPQKISRGKNSSLLREYEIGNASSNRRRRSSILSGFFLLQRKMEVFCADLRMPLSIQSFFRNCFFVVVRQKIYFYFGYQ